jgi:hypothetical protein
VDFGDRPVRVAIYPCDATVKILIEADWAAPRAELFQDLAGISG